MKTRSTFLLATLATAALVAPAHAATRAACKYMLTDPPADTQISVWSGVPYKADGYDFVLGDIASKNDLVTVTMKITDLDAVEPWSLMTAKTFTFMWQGPGASTKEPVWYAVRAVVPYNWRSEYATATAPIEFWIGTSRGVGGWTPASKVTGTWDVQNNEIRITSKIADLAKLTKNAGQLKANAPMQNFMAETAVGGGTPTWVDRASPVGKPTYKLGAKSCSKVNAH